MAFTVNDVCDLTQVLALAEAQKRLGRSCGPVALGWLLGMICHAVVMRAGSVVIQNGFMQEVTRERSSGN
jgi:hypothetical protein